MEERLQPPQALTALSGRVWIRHSLPFGYAAKVSEILFVCTANLCRSPMAEFLWNSMGGTPPATSAGVWARPGLAMHPFTAAELKRRGIAADEAAVFRSRSLSHSLLGHAELILCMEESHREKILSEFPAVLNKTFTVLTLAKLSVQFPDASRRELQRLSSRLTAVDLTDPVNLPESEFTRTGDVLATALPAIARWVDIDRAR